MEDPSEAEPPRPEDGVAALCRFVLLSRTALVLTMVAAALLVAPDPRPTIIAGLGTAVVAGGAGVLLARRPLVVRHRTAALLLDVALVGAVFAVAGSGAVYLAVSCTASALAGALYGLRAAPLWLALTAAGYLLTGLTVRDAADLPPAVALQLAGAPPLHVLAGAGAAAARAAVLRQLALVGTAMAAIRRSAVAGERGRMARELHDSVAQTLRGLSFAAVALPASLDRRPELAGELAGTVARAAATAADEARDLLDTLRADDGRAGFADVLERTCRQWSLRTGIDVRTRLDPLEVLELGLDTRHELLRIVREALSNVERHAAASAVRVEVLTGRGARYLSVRDDGIGFPVPDDVTALSADGHYGLIGMAERAERIGAGLTVASRPGVGSTVTVRIPQPAGSVRGAGESA